jgi:hypothetical protein
MWVNVSDDEHWTREWFTFTNEEDIPPDAPTLQYPLENTGYGTVYLYYFNCSVNDPDYDPLTIFYYWSNSTLFGIVENSTNGNVSLDRTELTIWWLQHDTIYEWYVILDDGTEHEYSVIWTYHTSKAWDLNEDRNIDTHDVSLLVEGYGDEITPGSLGCDINNDGFVDTYDVDLLVTYYGDVY